MTACRNKALVLWQNSNLKELAKIVQTQMPQCNLLGVITGSFECLSSDPDFSLPSLKATWLFIVVEDVSANQIHTNTEIQKEKEVASV
jgi:hypothetical protein